MNYYYLIAGLPDVSISDRQAAMSPEGVTEELLAGVSRADSRLLELFLHRHDNANLLALLSARPDTEPAWDEGALLSQPTLAHAVEAVRVHGREAEVPEVPGYMKEFLVGYFAPESLADLPEGERSRFGLSRLSELYYREAERCKSPVVAQWYAYERTLSNLLAAYSCRSLGIDPAAYIIGDDEVAEALRTSRAAGWGLTVSDFEDVEAVAQIAAGTDAVEKERRLDDLRWRHLEEATALCHFGVERLLVFLAQLDIVRRWQRLDEAAGEAKLRQMIERLKSAANSE